MTLGTPAWAGRGTEGQEGGEGGHDENREMRKGFEKATRKSDREGKGTGQDGRMGKRGRK